MKPGRQARLSRFQEASGMKLYENPQYPVLKSSLWSFQRDKP